MFNWARAGLTLLVVLASIAATNLDKMQQLALTRYGSDVARLVGEWRAMLPVPGGLKELEKLERINNFFNHRIRWADDQTVWQQEDYWATLLETLSKGAGDCEDFAIAKYASLLISGIPESRMRLTYVRLQQQPGAPAVAHMILAYYPDPSAEPLILDNFVAEIRTASKRPDLVPVYAFNATNLWIPGASAVGTDPTARISKWRDVLARLQAEFTL
ncbi:MAG: transglutaminase-like cysteine peptidase [Comamonadaceae bacterium]